MVNWLLQRKLISTPSCSIQKDCLNPIVTGTAWCVSVNRPKASQAERKEQSIKHPQQAEGMETGREEVAVEVETSEALPLFKTDSDTEQDCTLGNCQHLAEYVPVWFSPLPRVSIDPRRMMDAERREQKQPKSANVTQNRGF